MSTSYTTSSGTSSIHTITLNTPSGSICYPNITVSGGTGASGSTLQYNSNGTYTTAWASPNTNWNSSNGKPVLTIPHGEDKLVLEKQAELEVKGRVVINGEDLEERLKRIELLLNIPTRDVKMEDKHPKLKQLFEQYMYELEKYKTWDRLNGNE